MNGKNTLFNETIVLTIAIPVISVLANSSLEMIRHSIDGGAMLSTGAGFELSATIGQPDAGVLSGGGFELTGGFWFRIPQLDCDDDGDVRLSDHARYVACDLGPSQAIPEECRCFDVDVSDTVDLFDFAAFQRAFTGPLPPGASISPP